MRCATGASAVCHPAQRLDHGKVSACGMTDQLSDNRLSFTRPLTGELKKRLVSAIVMASVGIGAIVAGAWPLAILVGVIACILAWEWGRLARGTELDTAAFVHGGTIAISVGVVAAGLPIVALLIVFAGTIAIAIMTYEEMHRLSAFGVAYIGLAACGLVWLRADDGGASAILLVFACVWAHDTFAMLMGRAIGGPRLWPSVSPNKTWSGAVSGWLASLAAAITVGLMLGGDHLVWLAGLGLMLGGAALLGDLAASGIKRVGRVKHASNLIPGHGGFLDRFDGAIASFLVACLIVLLINSEQPVRVLLHGP